MIAMSNGRTPTVHVVVGNPHAGGRTSQVGIAVGEALCELRPDLSIDVIELAVHAPQMFEWNDPDLAEVVDRIMHGSALVVASPTYKASYTGLLKAFLDRFAAGSLVGVVTVPVMLGAGEQHALAVESQLRPVLVELGATMPAAGLYVVDSELDGVPDIVDRWLDTHRPVLEPLLGVGDTL